MISLIFVFKVFYFCLLNNNVDIIGGVLIVSDVNIFEIKDFFFDGNIVGNFLFVGFMEFGGVLYISCGLIIMYIVIMNMIFKNCLVE